LKFIDFGTSKDLIETDLNGNEFVGTSEYMSPRTVHNKNCGVESDLWALGFLVF
jgi:serine/threonine protein kinase